LYNINVVKCCNIISSALRIHKFLLLTNIAKNDCQRLGVGAIWPRTLMLRRAPKTLSTALL